MLLHLQTFHGRFLHPLLSLLPLTEKGALADSGVVLLLTVCSVEVGLDWTQGTLLLSGLALSC